VSGGYLAFFFMLSHNFMGAATYAPTHGLDGGEKDYLTAVLETSSNVGGAVSSQRLNTAPSQSVRLCRRARHTLVGVLAC
jgi:hypothetical protein